MKRFIMMIAITALAAAPASFAQGRGHAAFSSSFPRGRAWGLRRRMGLPSPRGSRSASISDGTTIRRAGTTWTFDSGSNTWIPQ